MSKYINRNSIIIAVVFGLASLITVAGGIHFAIPGTSAATDPREIFNSLGSALSGPIGAIIIAVLSTIKGSPSGFEFYITAQHLISALWISLAYKYLGYNKYRMPALAGIWVLIMLVYYIPIYIPGYLALYYFNHDLWNQFVGHDLSFWSATIKLFSGWIPEMIFTITFTALIIIALPENNRRPLWGKCNRNQELKSRGVNKYKFYYKYFAKNFIGIRLTLWFILLFSIALFYISILTRNYFSDYILSEETLRQNKAIKYLALQVEGKDEENLADYLVEINEYTEGKIILTDNYLNPRFGSTIEFDNKKYKEEIINNKIGQLFDSRKKRLIGYNHIDKKKLILLSISDLSVYDTDLNSIIDFLFYKFGITLLIISILCIVIIYFIVGNPIKKLTLVAEEIGKLNYDVKIDTEYMTDEVKYLATAVEEMKNNIQNTRKVLIENKQRLNTLSDATFEGIGISENGIMIDANKQLIEMFGYNDNELIGISILNLVAEESIEVVKLAITDRTESHYEYYAKRKDGSIFPVEVRAREININDRILRLSAVRDISAIKKYQTDLLTAKERAEKSNRLKSEFLAQMSHEIRSPLGVILSFFSIIKDETNSNTSPVLTDSFQSIEMAGKRIIRTVDLILNMSEMQVGSYEPKYDYIDIYENIISNVVKEYNQAVKNKGLELNVLKNTTNTIVYADHYSLSQIAVNLVDNAIKYTNKGSITIEIGRNKLEELIFTVEDTGIGILNEYLPHLFDAFSQEEQGYTRSFEGSGLGLSLVSKYCEINSAEISVESVKHKGTLFTVTFHPEKL
jgi:PAS domain S-box-containing protein